MHVGYFAAEQPVKDIDGISVEALVREHGSPLYVFSEAAIREKYRQANRAFGERYPMVQFAWSYKTNYLAAICNIFHSEGSFAEVVSDFEYEKARKHGVPGERIVFNGPYKTHEILRRAAVEGAKIQIDNSQEVFHLERIAAELNRQIPVTIRVNLQTGEQPAWRKFGFALENGEALHVLERVATGGRLKPIGLHAHIGRFISDAEQYKTATLALLNLAQQASERDWLSLEYLNLGGGFAISPARPNQLHSDSASAAFAVFADAICGALDDHLPEDQPKPTLFLETGRALVDDAGYLITTVLDVRHSTALMTGQSTALMANHSADGRQSAILDAGVNLLPPYAGQKYNIYPTCSREGETLRTMLYGPLCMNTDIVREDLPLPALQPDDRLVLHPVGAYHITHSMQFITYRPAVVLIGPNSQIDVIRKRENLDHIESLEDVPGRLAGHA